jgi:hypothetical protein
VIFLIFAQGDSGLKDGLERDLLQIRARDPSAGPVLGVFEIDSVAPEIPEVLFS